MSRCPRRCPCRASNPRVSRDRYLAVRSAVGRPRGAQEQRGEQAVGPSPGFHRRLGPLLSTDDGKPTPLALVCYAILSLVPLIFYVFGSAVNRSVIWAVRQGDAKEIVHRTFGGVVYASWLYCFHALRRVTRTGGELDQLGAGCARRTIHF